MATTGTTSAGQPDPAKARRMLAVATVFVAAFTLLGVFLLVEAVHTRDARQPIPGGVRTAGTITDVGVSCVRGCTYTPTISFTADGQTYTFTGQTRDGRPAVGSPDPVSYDPADPNHARDLGAGSAGWIVDAVLGAFFASFGLWFAYLAATAGRRRRRKAERAAAKAQPGWDPTWDPALRDAPRDADPS